MVDNTTATLGLVALLTAGSPAAAQSTQPPAAATASPAGAAQVGGRPTTTADVPAVQSPPANADVRTEFRVRFVRQDTVYLDGGYAAGLKEGLTLIVRDAAPPGGQGQAVVAELVIVGVASSSSVAEVHSPTRPVVVDDKAYLSSESVQAVVDQQALGTTRKFPAVISFTEGADVLDQEAHADVPRPPLPSANRARGRFGFDYLGFASQDTGAFHGRDVGLMFQGDFTGIAGSNWTLSGYWRGRLNTTSSDFQPTLQDLINRTYHLSLTYDAPSSSLVAGIGRLYLPWATSLETLDGGYIGARLSRRVTTGVFAGSSPDPTSYSYDPDLERGGAFVNVQGGRFDAVHYSSTVGAGVDYLKWQLDRPFLFLENTVNAGQTFSIYHALQADRPNGNPAVTAPGAGIGRSFLTVRWAPVEGIQFDANDTYFRDIPTFDPRLIGTGLLDKYLFQGYSGGARVEVLKGISVYTELGRSDRTGDSARSLNEMYGVTVNHAPIVGAGIDAHYSRFSSAFGTGNYRAVSVARPFGQSWRLDVLAGNQTFESASTANQGSRFVTTTIDASPGGSAFVDGSVTVYRGPLQNYTQWLVTVGYRFDTRRTRP